MRLENLLNIKVGNVYKSIWLERNISEGLKPKKNGNSSKIRKSRVKLNNDF